MCDGIPASWSPYCGPECAGAAGLPGVFVPVPPEKTKVEEMAAIDARLTAAFERGWQSAAGTSPETPRPATADTDSTRTVTTRGRALSASSEPAPASSTAPRPKGRRPPKKPRRTALQMQRAAEQERREAALRVERATRGTYLEGALEEEDRWAASLRDAGND